MTTTRCLIAMSLMLTGIVVAEPAATNAVQTGKGHKFACTDYSGQKVFVVNEKGAIEWEYKTGQCNDLWVLPNGNLLFNTGRGVQEVDKDKKVVFSYESKGEVFACQRLANGNTFIGECGLGRLIEVDPKGKVVKEIKLLKEGENGGHAYMRNARKLANGNYLVTHYGGQTVKEYDPSGKMVREIPAPGGAHSVARLPNGNTLIACGDMKGASKLIEVDPKDKIVWEVSGDELPGVSLKFVAGFHRLPNGNTVICNWLGHGNLGKSAHLVEVTRDKKVVWTFQDHKNMKTISNVQILDVPGNATKNELIH